MNDFIIYIALGLGFIIAIINLFFWRDLKNPAVLHSLLWLTIIALHTFVSHGLNALNIETYLIVIAAMFLFSCGAALGLNFWINKERAQEYRLTLPNQRIINLYFYLALIGLPFLLVRALDLASHGVTDNFFVNLRLSLINEDEPQGYGILAYLLPVAYSSLFLFLLDKNKSLKSIKIFSMLMICLTYAFFSTGRTYLFLLLIPAIFILSLTRQNYLSLKKILVFIGIFILLFFFYQGMRGGEDGGGNAGMSVFWIYLLGGVTAFQELFSTTHQFEYGSNMFRTIYVILSKLGFDVEVKGLIQGYTYIPTPTNVYSVFAPYFLDFGIYFSLSIQLLLGVIHGNFYKFAKRKNSLAVLFYSLSMYPLFMQWFQDQYFTLISTWVIFGLLLLVPFIKIPALSDLFHTGEQGG